MADRIVGIDIGAETIKLVELNRNGKRLEWTRRLVVEHGKQPQVLLPKLLEAWDWGRVRYAAGTGRLARQLRLPKVPTKQAQAAGYRFLFGETPATIVSIGSHGFSVLELRGGDVGVFRENSRCSQGTGNFLRQLVERFDLSLEEANALCEGVEQAAPLSGRCPVILKTDMTHLANKGEPRAHILAGLYDAVCENVEVLIKPRTSPSRVVLTGGVTRSSRIRDHFAGFLARHGMKLEPLADDDALFLDALGCAVLAVTQIDGLPALDELIEPAPETHLERLPPLSDFLKKVTRLPAPPAVTWNGHPRAMVLGFDIGSTGSKAVAMETETRAVLWEGYLNTSGNPVGAAQSLMQRFVASPAAKYPVLALGVTGSGREVVGSLMSTCYGVEAVYILNEIAAHAEGALSYDKRVDTIFEIGGQDAKYIRLAEGRVVDAAMNEACSAGTGSFIEEQGRKLSGIRDVVHLGQEALEAPFGVSLGQHCSVFMAEIIDEAVAAGTPQPAIIAGIYDAIIQNYLNRVKGSRSVGDVIFCQGMPFASSALAAAVARQTGSEVIVPPNPGLMGAIGISLLTLREIRLEARVPLLPERFLNATVERKDTFVCKSTVGCGGAGNKCRIDRIRTQVDGTRQKFTWGGGCSLYDKGTGKRKLPDRAPDPFREREALVREIVERNSQPRGRLRVALSDEFMLKSLFPFFATFLHELDFDIVVATGADQRALKRGIEECNVPFCAPMQQFHGLVSAMAETDPDFLFIPMLRSIPKAGNEPHAKVCPIVQGSPDILRWDVGDKIRARIISTTIDVEGSDLRSPTFIECCQQVASDFGKPKVAWRSAYREALKVQNRFEARCRELGREALEFCSARGIVPVIVLGRTYTIYNTVLNSNVPVILREQGALAIPVDCYPIERSAPVFNDIYWGYSQINLRAAHQIRRTEGQYSIFCSNYSCGPDSFSLHFYSYIMEGKPFAIIETDGHSGDAGTKTRIEAFLHCVREDEGRVEKRASPHIFKHLEFDKDGLEDIRQRSEQVLIPRMGQGAEAFAAALRGLGLRAEALPLPTSETLRIGRRYTSGKECVPMTITLGSLLERLEQDRDTEELFSFFMPSASGPCRFGVYNLLHKIALERLGWKDRVRIWSPSDRGYFVGVPAGFAAMVFSGFMAADLLLEAFYDARPVEVRPGVAREIYATYMKELSETLEREGRGDLGIPSALLQVASGRFFGCADVLKKAATAFATIKEERQVPTVLLVGEIYVRCDPFANDFAIDKLEAKGIRVRFAPFNEWLEYTDHLSLEIGRRSGLSERLSSFVQSQIQERTYAIMAETLGWPERTRVGDSLDAVSSYLRKHLHGEAVLTVGGPLHEWRGGYIDGVISVGPLECMPNKIAEAQFFHAAQREGVLSLTLSVNGDPVDSSFLDNFAFEVFERFRQRQSAGRRLSLPERSSGLLRQTRRRTARLLAAPIRGPLEAMAAVSSRASTDGEDIDPLR